MCGLLLYISKKKINLHKFSESLDLINHRGPDNSTILSYQNDNFKNHSIDKNYNQDYNFLMGHKRLSIIDLSKNSNQPFIDTQGKLFFLYNGEFYNYKDYTTPDTIFSDGKTLFNSIRNHNTSFFDEILGMWSIVYGDLTKNTIYFSRDFYGKKPLYYYHDNETLIISSEFKSIFNLKNISRKINIDSLSYFITYKMSPFRGDDKTFYENIKSVKPGDVLEYNIKTNEIKFKNNIKNNLNLNKKINESNFKLDFHESIKRRMISDVKIGTFLSGGIDSSLISAYTANERDDINYYCAYNVDRNDEAKDDLYYARKLSDKLKLDLTEVPIEYSYDSYLKILNTLSKQFEIPVNYAATPFPSYFILKKMKSDGVKVSIDGIGGDEIMGYYPNYLGLAISNIRSNRYKSSFQYLISHILNSNNSFFRKQKDLAYFIYKGFFKNSFLEIQKNIRSFSNNVVNKDFYNNLEKNIIANEREKLFDIVERQLFAIKNGISFYIGVADQVSMMFSIENRSPFLDKNIYKYVRMNKNFKFNKGFNKYLLRNILAQKGFEKIAWRKEKTGFSNFGQRDFTANLKNREYILDDNFIRSFVNIEKVQLLFDNLNNPRANFTIANLLSIASLSKNYKLTL